MKNFLCLIICVLVIVSAVLSGCDKKEKKDLGGATPEEVVEKFHKADSETDIYGVLLCFADFNVYEYALFLDLPVNADRKTVAKEYEKYEKAEISTNEDNYNSYVEEMKSHICEDIQEAEIFEQTDDMFESYCNSISYYIEMGGKTIQDFNIEAFAEVLHYHSWNKRYYYALCVKVDGRWFLVEDTPSP